MTNKQKLAFAFMCITIPLWAIPAAILAMYSIGTDQASFTLVVK